MLNPDFYFWNSSKAIASYRTDRLIELVDETSEGLEEYWSITTTDGKGSNTVSGGMMKRAVPEQQGILNYIYVELVDEYSEKVKQLGRSRLSKSP